MSRMSFLRGWSIAVGSMDTVTGVFLIFMPTMVLTMLGVSVPSLEALDFLRWIGVFVLGIGLSYGMALGRRSRGETVWAFTAMVRTLVAVFLTARIVAGSMASAWFGVAATDGVVAILQIVILRKGWWKEVRS